MTGRTAKDVDEYIGGYPPEVQRKLQEIRQTIRKAAPDAEEKINYGIPTFALNGDLVFFAAFAKHISVYPAPRGNDAFADELSRYAGGKGTVQFPLDEPIPYDLIRRMTEFRVEENLSRKKSKPKR